MKCKIADFNVELKNLDSIAVDFFSKYADDFEEADFTLSVTEEDIKREGEMAKEKISRLNMIVAAYQRKLCENIYTKNALLMHSALISTEDTGIAFLAKSGTGKTTHTLLWKQLLGDKLSIINGDKPIIRIIDGEVFAYGTPWCGKEGFSENRRVKLSHICFIKRSLELRPVPIETDSGIEPLLNQIYLPKSAKGLEKTLALADAMVNRCKMWEIYCDKTLKSAEIAYNSIQSKVDK